MSTPNPFLKATKQSLRFSTNRGLITTEDLWQLSLEDLDRLAVHVDACLTAAPKKSFISDAKPKGSADDELRIEVLKAVIEEKLTDREASKKRAADEQQRAFLRGLIEKKKAGETEQLSVTELEKQLAELGG